MELHIAAALKQPGEIFQAELQGMIVPQLFGGREILFAEPLKLSFSYSFDGKAFTLKGMIAATLASHCASCNAPFYEELQFPFEERFLKGSAVLEEECYAFDGEVIDLTTMALDNLFLHLPIRSLCEADCKGLCPVCGINWNTSQCACTREERGKHTLGALEQLLSDDKEV